MDPFDDDDPNEPPEAPPKRRRPWWYWNPFTLVAVLFVLVWARELFGLSPGAAWGWVFAVFALWLVGPGIATGAPLWSPRPATRGSNKRARLPAGGVCRLAAVVVGATGLVQAYANIGWAFSGMGVGAFRGAWFGWIVNLFASSGLSIALAIGLWTLGGLAAQMQQLSDRLEDREPPPRERR